MERPGDWRLNFEVKHSPDQRSHCHMWETRLLPPAIESSLAKSQIIVSVAR